MRRICWPTSLVLFIAFFASISGSTYAQETGIEGASVDASQTAVSVEKITQAVTKSLEATIREAVRAELNAAGVPAPAEPKCCAELREKVQVLTNGVRELEREFRIARDDLDKQIGKLERITLETSDGGIILRQQTSLPVGTVTIHNRTPYPQRMWVNKDEVLLPGYGTSRPVQVLPGAVVTRLEYSGEGPRDWHVGPGNNHNLVLYINP